MTKPKACLSLKSSTRAIQIIVRRPRFGPSLFQKARHLYLRHNFMFNHDATLSNRLQLCSPQVQAFQKLAEGDAVHPVHQIWLDLGVPQCGYCQAGEIIAAVALEQVPEASPDRSDAAMDRNLCPCGRYVGDPEMSLTARYGLTWHAF